MMRTMNKALCIAVINNYHFHKLNAASAEYHFSPATPITNTIQCKLYVSQVKSPFTFVAGANESSNEITPEFIGKMVYSSNHIITTPARLHGLMCFGHYILHTEADSQSLTHIYTAAKRLRNDLVWCS